MAFWNLWANVDKRSKIFIQKSTPVVFCISYFCDSNDLLDLKLKKALFDFFFDIQNVWWQSFALSLEKFHYLDYFCWLFSFVIVRHVLLVFAEGIKIGTPARIQVFLNEVFEGDEPIIYEPVFHQLSQFLDELDIKG